MLKVLGVAMVALVAACVSPPPTPLPVTTQAPPGFPEAYYKEAANFGITPLSVLGGAIQVQDEVQMRFRIRASAMNETRAAARGTAAEPGSTDITLSKSDR